MKPKAFVIMGLSNCGKTTAARYLEDAWEMPEIYSIKPLKQMYEKALGLEDGALDTPEGKSIVTSTGHSMRDVLVSSFQVHRKVLPELGALMLHQQLAEALTWRTSITITGVRNIEEAHATLSYADYFELHVVYIESPRTLAVASDIYVGDIMAEFMDAKLPLHLVNNDGSESEMFQRLDYIVVSGATRDA